MERLGYPKGMIEESQNIEEEKYIPPATLRATNATPLTDRGKRMVFRQAIPQEEYEKIGRREAIKKGTKIVGGLLAAAAGIFGLAKAFERAWQSPEPSIEAGKKAGEQFQRTKKIEEEIDRQLPGNAPKVEPTPTSTPQLWEKPAVTPEAGVTPSTIDERAAKEIEKQKSR